MPTQRFVSPAFRFRADVGASRCAHHARAQVSAYHHLSLGPQDRHPLSCRGRPVTATEAPCASFKIVLIQPHPAVKWHGRLSGGYARSTVGRFLADFGARPHPLRAPISPSAPRDGPRPGRLGMQRAAPARSPRGYRLSVKLARGAGGGGGGPAPGAPPCSSRAEAACR